MDGPDDLTLDPLGNWERHDIFEATLGFTNERVSSWVYQADFNNHELNLHWEILVSGGKVEAYWQNDVCDGLVEMTYVRTIDGAVDARLAAPVCDISSNLEITLRD